jgi:STELLO glycosyltransferases
LIVETDDDSIASSRFWAPRTRLRSVKTVAAAGWTNAYRYFTERAIWPRGFPLDRAHATVPRLEELPSTEADCPIQQGLVDEDPDVDAVYRLLFPLPFAFERGAPVALGAGSWCPFNSQNTAWWRDAFPLMYLPATCSFRMTDIWRSFVAQRIAWANDWSILFTEATVHQRRNEHDLNKDFADEVAGYLENGAMCAALDALDFAPGIGRIAENMRLAYGLLVERGWLDAAELPLLDAWLADVDALLPTIRAAVAS